MGILVGKFFCKFYVKLYCFFYDCLIFFVCYYGVNDFDGWVVFILFGWRRWKLDLVVWEWLDEGCVLRCKRFVWNDSFYEGVDGSDYDFNVGNVGCVIGVYCVLFCVWVVGENWYGCVINSVVLDEECFWGVGGC